MKMKRKIPETITEEELIRILKVTKKNKIKLAFLLGFYQGMRVSEVIKLKSEDVNIETGFLHIKQGKGCKDRDIPIMKPIKFYLRYLPVNVTRQALYQSIKSKAVKILKKKISFHTLRHSGASMYLNDKVVDIRQIQQLLGHSRLSTTQIYTHVNPKQLKNAFDKAWI